MNLPESIKDKYDIVLPLGEGGMGAVFKVRHRLLNEVRVIKVIRPAVADHEGLKARFLREAQAAAELRHPNVAQIYDFAIDPDGTPYIVMEFIAGPTWRQLIDRLGPLPVPLAVEMASQCLGALEYLHQRSFVHRDVAPDNLMLSRGVEGRLQVKLIDLGLAKRLTGDVGLTTTGGFIGKLRYASPEQFHAADAELDPRSDLYSLGVVLFELLTGACPIEGNSPERIIGSHLHGTAHFSGARQGNKVPAGLQKLVLAALQQEPRNRPQTAGEFRKCLEPFRQDDLPDLDELLPGEDDATLLLPSGPRAPFPDRAAKPRGTGSTGRLSGTRVRLLVAGVLALLLVWVLRQWPSESGRSQTGTAVIDAAPWAQLSQILNDRGDVVPLPEPAETPAVLFLAPGRYSVFLTHPEMDQARRLEVDVVADETVQSAVDLQLVDLDRYFEDAGLGGYLREAGSE